MKKLLVIVTEKYLKESTAMRKLILFVSTALIALSMGAQTLVKGGQFKDRILPMQGSVTKSAGQNIWGQEGVQGRFLDNGAEPASTTDGKPTLSYWGGNIVKDANGTYHMYLAGWDATQRAHSYWPNSDVYHLTSTNPSGPFNLTSNHNIGTGHNPTVFQAADGTYVLYVLIGNTAAYRYKSSTLGDSWGAKELMPTNLRDRALSTGTAQSYSNWTFAQRPDGSVYCMDRGGAMWISETGLSDFEEVCDKSAYPGGYQRYFEDPVVWRDEFQYHMIVNHWNNKIAYYSRSKDGFHWISETGTAYDPTVAMHADGKKETWDKFERPRVYQDQYGRATHLNMAVIDSDKGQDLAGDIHSSKNIVMPLNPGIRMEVLNTEKITTSTTSIRIKIYKEEGFTPATDLNIGTLRFGSHGTVNTGGGASATSHETDADGNLILTFNGASSGLTADEFAPKIIGQYTDGKMCYGHARLSYIDYEPAYLSPVLPTISNESKTTGIKVKNYGLKTSREGAVIKVLSNNGAVIATGTVPATDKYATVDVSLTATSKIPAGSTALKVTVCEDGVVTDTHILQLTDAVAAQQKLQTVVSEAEALHGNATYKEGKEEILSAITAAKSHLNSFYIPELAKAESTLAKAVNAFKFSNATSHNPVSITIVNADMSSLEGWELLNTESKGFHINSSNNHDYNALGRNPFMEAYNGGGITSPNYAQQTFKDMPAGKYVFSADVIAQRGTGECTGIVVFANNETANCSSTQQNHSENYSVELILTEKADITVGLKVLAGSNATWVGFDNAQLKYYGDGSHDNDPIIHNISCKNYYLKTANSSSGNIYCYVDANGAFARKTTKEDTGIFTIIRDDENNRNYIYNPSSKTFVGFESEWKASSTIAFMIPEIANSTTTSNAYTIKGGMGASTYLNAKGGTATHTDFAAYNGTDANSQWSLEECTNQTYTFDITDIATGTDEFLATASLIDGATIIQNTTSIKNIGTEQDKTSSCIFSISGHRLAALQKGINILNRRKILVY